MFGLVWSNSDNFILTANNFKANISFTYDFACYVLETHFCIKLVNPLVTFPIGNNSKHDSCCFPSQLLLE